MSKIVEESVKLIGESRKCSVLMIEPSMIWRASFKKEIHNARANIDRKPEEMVGYDFIPFLLCECVLFDGAPATLSDLEKLMIDDYLSVMEVVNPLFNKINL